MARVGESANKGAGVHGNAQRENSMMHSCILSVSYGWCLIAKDGHKNKKMAAHRWDSRDEHRPMKILSIFRSLDFCTPEANILKKKMLIAWN